MKILVIGGTGLIGSKTVSKLRDLGHTVISAAPATGINTITGEGYLNVKIIFEVQGRYKSEQSCANKTKVLGIKKSLHY